jgi:phage tail sheath protein FI
VCEIGIAPVKPAEFVIFRLSQYADGGGQVEA